MRPDEVAQLDVSDMRRREGYYRVNVSSRPITRGHVEVLVPPEVVDAVEAAKGARRSGPLITRRDGRRLDRASIRHLVQVSAKRAEIPFRVGPMTLAYTLRALAIEHGFSYIGVVRAVGEMHPTKAARWIVGAPNSPEQHAAIRLGRLVFHDQNSVAGILDEAEICLTESVLPDAIAVMTAGAALEKHLREMCRAIDEIEFDKPETQLQMGAYRHALTRHRVLATPDIKKIETVESHRNDAAHGWFELITPDVAREVVRYCREVIHKYQVGADGMWN
jgi:hypothetical protein